MLTSNVVSVYFERSKITQVSYLTQTVPMNSYSQGKRNDTRINAYVALRARNVKRWQSEITYDFTFNHKKDLQDALTLAFWERGGEDCYNWNVDSKYPKGTNTKSMVLVPFLHFIVIYMYYSFLLSFSSFGCKRSTTAERAGR